MGGGGVGDTWMDGIGVGFGLLEGKGLMLMPGFVRRVEVGEDGNLQTKSRSAKGLSHGGCPNFN